MYSSLNIRAARLLTPCALAMLAWVGAAHAQTDARDGGGGWRSAPIFEALSFEASYVADGIGVISGGVTRDAAYLDNLSVAVDVDLEKALRWRGAALHLQGLSNLGGKPNAFVGTLEGVDNIEVADARPKLFELWLEQKLFQERLALAIGFFDLNASYYANDAAGIFLSPPFGIGSELASTGPSGPSISPRRPWVLAPVRSCAAISMCRALLSMHRRACWVMRAATRPALAMGFC